MCCRLKEAREVVRWTLWTLWVPVPRARVAPPGLRTEDLSSGQALAAGPHALCLGEGGAQEAQVARSQARCAEGAWASQLPLKAVPGHVCSCSLGYLGFRRAPTGCPVTRAYHSLLYSAQVVSEGGIQWVPYPMSVGTRLLVTDGNLLPKSGVLGPEPCTWQ